MDGDAENGMGMGMVGIGWGVGMDTGMRIMGTGWGRDGGRGGDGKWGWRWGWEWDGDNGDDGDGERKGMERGKRITGWRAQRHRTGEARCGHPGAEPRSPGHSAEMGAPRKTRRATRQPSPRSRNPASGRYGSGRKQAGLGPA